MPKDPTAAHLLIQGRVQGVGYRFFAHDAAEAHNLNGWVRNLPDGNVECEVEGPRSAIEAFIEDLRKGPPIARVDAVTVEWKPRLGQFTDFSIRG